MRRASLLETMERSAQFNESKHDKKPSLSERLLNQIG